MHRQSRRQSFFESGLHHKGKNCDIKQEIEELNAQYRRASDSFFPDKFTITGVSTFIKRIKKPYGG
jgi:hypothetical protein